MRTHSKAGAVQDRSRARRKRSFELRFAIIIKNSPDNCAALVNRRSAGQGAATSPCLFMFVRWRARETNLR